MKLKPTLTLVALVSAISVFAQSETAYTRFITTYLPLPDRLSLDTAYIGRQVRLAMHSRSVMPWGHTVPEAEFRHFVLPPRVACEALDDSRAALAGELCPLVAAMDMASAAMEVNHWCRSQADIRPDDDSRTLSPSATIATAYGNPTEAAVLLVAALRAVCIPARLVATEPDDASHSPAVWVEAWADGQWHSMEPCRPHEGLDMGSHMKAAATAGRICTYAFGQWEGDEPTTQRGALLTQIDRTAAYQGQRHTWHHADSDRRATRTDLDRRLASDDAHRQAREARMHNPLWRGNAANIEAFLAGPWDRRLARTLLGQLTEKDLHDVTLEVLHDNIYTQASAEVLNDIQMQYVVNPRIEREPLTPYKWTMRKQMAHIDSLPQLVRWCRDSIMLVRGQNPQHLRQTPTVTYRHRQADAMGKKIFFAAVARSLGWAVRIDAASGRLQWHDDEQWHDVEPLSYIDMPPTPAKAPTKRRTRR